MLDINLVPFIDLMIVLVSFLLITAVWTNLRPDQHQAGRRRTRHRAAPTAEPPINLSVLVAKDGIWIGHHHRPAAQDRQAGRRQYNFDSLAEALQYYKKESGIFNERDDVEIAAEDKVDYQAVISTMDTAVAKEFKGIRYVDPSSLSVRFKQ